MRIREGEEIVGLKKREDLSCIRVRVLLVVSTHLVLSVILLGMAQHSVAQPANVSERSMALVAKFLQSKHGAITAICERGLKKFENLQRKGRIIKSKKGPKTDAVSCFKTNLFQDVLLPHQFLSFSVGFVHHDLQDILPTVRDVHHEEN